MPALLLNDVDALARWGFVLAEAPGWADAPSRQTPVGQIVGRAGAKPLAAPSEQSRRVTLRGAVRASSVAACRANLDSLRLALFASPLKLVFGDYPSRHLYVSFESFNVGVLAGSQIQPILPVEVSLIAHDPYAYDNALTTVAIGDRMPLGTGVVRPLVSIIGVSNNPVITLKDKADVTRGSLTLTAASIAGDTITIDHDAKTVTKNGVSILSAISAGDFFSIDPANAALYSDPWPYITVSSGAGNVSFRKTWR